MTRADNPFRIAFRTGYRLGAKHTFAVCAIIAAALMVGSFTALNMYADGVHERAVAAIEAENRKTLNRCQYIAETVSGKPYAELLDMANRAEARGAR